MYEQYEIGLVIPFQKVFEENKSLVCSIIPSNQEYFQSYHWHILQTVSGYLKATCNAGLRARSL